MVTEGFEVLSTEIENALMSHPGVTEAAAIEVLHPRGGAAVHAVVTLRPHAIVAVAELMSALRERTCAGALSATIEFGGPLPRTPLGDVDKRALRASHWPRQDGRVPGAPQTNGSAGTAGSVDAASGNHRHPSPEERS